MEPDEISDTIDQLDTLTSIYGNLTKGGSHTLNGDHTQACDNLAEMIARRIAKLVLWEWQLIEEEANKDNAPSSTEIPT